MFLRIITLVCTSVILFQRSGGIKCNGWTNTRIGQLKFVHTPTLDYDDAQASCETCDATLAKIKNEDANNVILELAKHKYWVWVGGVRNLRKDGPPKYANWAPSQPDGDGNCIMMMGSGKWNDIACSDNRMSYVCARETEFEDCTQRWKKTSILGYLKFYNGPKTFNDAQDHCKRCDAELVQNIDRWMDNVDVARMIRDKQLSWIGLKKNGMHGQMTWLDGTPLTYNRNWARGEANNKDQDCVVMSKDGKWKDEFCYISAGFICQKYSLDYCKGGWKQTKSGMMKLFLWEMNYNDAKQQCEKCGAHLVDGIKNDEENGRVQNFVGKRCEIWLGLTYTEGGRGWVWDNGLNRAIYSHWESQNRGIDEDCAVMGKGGYWRAIHCRDKRPYVCVKSD